MKEFDKSKFWFLENKDVILNDKDEKPYTVRTWIKKLPVNGDTYFNKEYRWGWKFPFYKKCYVIYKLVDDKWIEQYDI